MAKRTLLRVGYAIVVGLLIWGGFTRSTVKMLPGANIGQDRAETNAHEPASIKELIATSGLVTSMNEHKIMISLDRLVAPKNVILQGRPFRYAREQGLLLIPGDQIDITGFIENRDLEIVRIHDLTNGSTVQLRDLYGQPAWSNP